MNTKYNQWDRRLIFYALDHNGELGTIYGMSKHAKVSYGNGKTFFPDSINKLYNEGTFKKVNGKYVLAEIFKIEDPQMREAYLTMLKNNREVYWEVVTNKKYTYLGWVNKQLEISKKIKETQIGILTGKDSIINKVREQFNSK